jgi:hypothetical protein
MTKGMAKIAKITVLRAKGKKIVAWFTGPHFQSALLKRLSPNKDLIQGCDTRYGLYFLMFFRLEELRNVLLRVVVDQAYIDVKLKKDDVKPWTHTSNAESTNATSADAEAERKDRRRFFRRPLTLDLHLCEQLIAGIRHILSDRRTWRLPASRSGPRGRSPVGQSGH